MMYTYMYTYLFCTTEYLIYETYMLKQKKVDLFKFTPVAMHNTLYESEIN